MSVSKRKRGRRCAPSSAKRAASVARQGACEMRMLRSFEYAEREAAEVPPAADARDGLDAKNSSTRASLSSTVAITRPGAVRERTASLSAPSRVKREDTSEMLLRLARAAARQRRSRWLAMTPGGETELATAKTLGRRGRKGALHAKEATTSCFWSSEP